MNLLPIVFIAICVTGISIGFFWGFRPSEPERQTAQTIQPVGSPPPEQPTRALPSNHGTFEERLAEATNIDGGGSPRESVPQLFREWAQNDPDGAFEAWITNPNETVESKRRAVIYGDSVLSAIVDTLGLNGVAN
jgi:hypothetical protein